MKTAVSLPDELFALADKLAAERGMSRSELYARALRAYLGKESRQDLQARIDAACEHLDTSLPEDLRQLARATLQRSEW
jgi:antitoxin MazE6